MDILSGEKELSISRMDNLVSLKTISLAIMDVFIFSRELSLIDKDNSLIKTNKLFPEINICVFQMSLSVGQMNILHCRHNGSDFAVAVIFA
jgi:hypothetical protein